MKYFFSPKYYGQAVILSNQTLQIVECILGREENEKEGENKNKKWENSRDRLGYMALNIWKNSY